MSLYRSLSGTLRVELTGADITGSLDALLQNGISIYALETVDAVTVRFTARRTDMVQLTRILTKRGDRVAVKDRRGLYWYFRSALHRPVLTLGVLLFLTLGLWLPTRILFVEVEGNECLPTRLIVETASESGIRFGASRRAVRSERMKNALLDALPQLQWAGVNTYGCRAVISVRERPDAPSPPQTNRVSNIVAAMDGVITSCTVTRGTGTCVPGQAVKAGQTLISGFTDCGITIEATRAEGEIMARTRRKLEIVTPSEQLKRVSSGETREKYSLILGKNRINFYKGSGISGAGCVKMYTKYVLTLPGGFQLPVALVKETETAAELRPAPISDPASQMESFAVKYLSGRMVCGRIHDSDVTVAEEEGVYRLYGIYACTEMIGVEQDEMIGDLHGKTDGTDRERRPGG